MTVLTIRNFEDAMTAQLKLRAAANGKSIEEEAREILCSALLADDAAPRNIGEAIHARFAALNGVDLPERPRDAIRSPAISLAQ